MLLKPYKGEQSFIFVISYSSFISSIKKGVLEPSQTSDQVITIQPT